MEVEEWAEVDVGRRPENVSEGAERMTRQQSGGDAGTVEPL